jgi:protoporphyrinogen oxidase
VLDAHYVYFRDRTFHRVAEPTNSGLVVQPPGCSVLLVELTCSVGDDRWTGGQATRRQIVADLAAEGLLAPSDVMEMHVLRTAHGYPVFELGFEPHHQRVMDHLNTIPNLRTTGRQGGFTYPNMHEAMRMGATAAAELLGDG